MNWKSVSKMVGKAAPMLGTALGGPAGAAIGAMVANALGVENTPDAVSEAIKSNPESALKLRELELQNEAGIRDHLFKTLDIELKDVQNARENHKLSPVPGLICGALSIMVALLGWLIFFKDIPAENKEMAYILFGAVTTKWADSIAFFIGTTRSSAEKNRMLLK